VRQRFSERYGFVKVRDSFQIDSMDDGLKNRLWNKIKLIFVDTLTGYEYVYGGEDYISDNGILKKADDKKFILHIYDDFFKVSIEPLEYSKDNIKKDLKQRYMNFQWFTVYDFIEYISEIHYGVPSDFYDSINKILKEEMSGYRFVNNYIAPIIDEVEIEAVEEALVIEYNGAKRHLSNALEFLSDRENPDYPNSIKESISAVEAVAKEITGKNTDLSKCLKAMDLDLNKQFKTAMDNMYGWTCKEDGIRHGHTGEELKTSFEEAKYMLVTCSAFVNYMITKKGQK